MKASLTALHVSKARGYSEPALFPLWALSLSLSLPFSLCATYLISWKSYEGFVCFWQLQGLSRDQEHDVWSALLLPASLLPCRPSISCSLWYHLSLSHPHWFQYLMLMGVFSFFDLVSNTADGPLYDFSAYTQVSTKPGHLLYRFFSWCCVYLSSFLRQETTKKQQAFPYWIVSSYIIEAVLLT